MLFRSATPPSPAARARPACSSAPGSGIPGVRLGLPGVGPCPCPLGRPPDWSLVLGAPAASPLPDGDPLWRRSSPGASVHWGEWGGGGGGGVPGWGQGNPGWQNRRASGSECESPVSARVCPYPRAPQGWRREARLARGSRFQAVLWNGHLGSTACLSRYPSRPVPFPFLGLYSCVLRRR